MVEYIFDGYPTILIFIIRILPMSHENSASFKIESLPIDEYKMFKDFDIDFVDTKGKPLSIVVLAGVNGSGKTTLLEYIFKNKEHGQKPKRAVETLAQSGHKQAIDVMQKIYLRAGEDNIANVESEFVKYWYNLVKFHNKRNDEITDELQKFIAKVFDGLDLDVTYSYIDEDDNIYFQNTNNEKFRIDELSTGEKTLLSKVLYLYFKNYKDKVILIDEPELSLHPSWQNRVLKIYKNFADANNCQVIIATHSPHIIGSAKSESLRILKRIDGKIEAFKYSQSYGYEFSKILTDIMDVEYLRTPEVSKQLAKVKAMIVANEFDSESFQNEWRELESLLGANNLDLKLLKLEIASRKKNV